jgi:hypothetical protein
MFCWRTTPFGDAFRASPRTFGCMQPAAHLSRLRERFEDLLREVGTLLLAFAPLDAVLWGERPDRVSLVLTFVLIAISLIVLAFVSETRMLRG